jgi:exodeoxyribonuclease V gamma subunit
MREVEVLNDALLASLESDPGLRPRDIMVMAPDIERYAPYIQAVFGSPESEALKIPYSIADRGLSGTGGLAAALLELVDAASGRLGANAVLGLLELPPVARRFGMQEGDVELIRTWVEQTRIRWGGDASSRSQLGMPCFEEGTWAAGLDRLLLGMAMDGDGCRRYASILPHDGLDGSSADTLGRLAEYIDRLRELWSSVREPRSPGQWSALLQGAVENFLESGDEDVAELQMVRATLEELGTIPVKSGFDRPLPFAVVRGWLEERFTQRRREGGFLTGGVTFSAMVPMRSIPFRVIAVLGMDHDSFPRQETAADFDLMARRPRPGDRNVRMDDRSLFLETLLSARTALIVSYVGRDIQTNKPRPASVLVDELLEALDRDYRMHDGRLPSEAIVREHPLQSFDAAYFRPAGPLFSYSRDRCAAARNLLEPGSGPEPLLAAGLPSPPDALRTVSMTELVRFFLDPPAAFLRQRVGADVRIRSFVLEEEESLAGLDALDSYSFGQELLSRVGQA